MGEFIVGLIVGGTFGVIISALIVYGSREDERRDYEKH